MNVGILSANDRCKLGIVEGVQRARTSERSSQMSRGNPVLMIIGIAVRGVSVGAIRSPHLAICSSHVRSGFL